MEERHTGKSPFEDSKITVIIGDGRWEWGGGKGETRAVIELANDINDVMPKLSKVVNGVAFDPVNHIMGFRVDDYAVVINGLQILIIGAGEESIAQSVLDWLAGKIYGDEDNVEKHGNHIRKSAGKADWPADEISTGGIGIMESNKGKAALDGYQVNIFKGEGGWAWDGSDMTRAVIELSCDIGKYIPDLAKAINGYGFDFHGPSVGFRFEDLPVIIEKKRVTVFGTFDEAIAHRVIDWLNEKMVQIEAAENPIVDKE